MDEVESLRVGGAADATDFAGHSRKEDEQKKQKKEVDFRVTADGTSINAASDDFDGDGDDTERRAPIFVANFIRWVARSGAPLVSTSLDSLPSAPLPH